MQITQEHIEFLMLILSLLVAFYKITKIESGIKAKIAALEGYIKLHEKEHELIAYKMHEAKKISDNHQSILKRNNLLNRITD